MKEPFQSLEIKDFLSIFFPSARKYSRLFLTIFPASSARFASLEILAELVFISCAIWLIIQTENGNHRLQRDMNALQERFGNNLPIAVHTLENDDDGFCSLDDPAAVERIERLIEQVKPDIVAVDPFRDFIMGDPNSDGDMRRTLQELRRICRRNNPDRAIVIVHHSLTGKSGILKGSGYERSGFARNSKVLYGFARSQINLMPGSPDNNDVLVVQCAKNNDGREFPRFAIELDVNSMLYDVDYDFDWGKWDSEIGNQKRDAASHHPEFVLELVQDHPLTSDDIVTKINDRWKLTGDSVARELITKAKRLELIKKAGGLYVPAIGTPEIGRTEKGD